MLKIDDTLLQEVGLGSLPDEEKKRLLIQFREMLEMRVGVRLAKNMTDDQLDEFETFIDTNDQAGALKWLEANFPDYKQVVAEEFENLKKEIMDSAQAIQDSVSQPPAAA